MKIGEWFLCGEYDVYHSTVYFSHLLELWEIIWSCYFCGDVVDIDVNVDNRHDYVLVLIMVMLVNNHDDACWITMLKILVNYICICAYVLLVKFLHAIGDALMV